MAALWVRFCAFLPALLLALLVDPSAAILRKQPANNRILQANITQRPDKCERANNCFDCVNSFGGCGWCKFGSFCSTGDNAAPTHPGRVCKRENWKYEPHSCAPETKLPTSPAVEGDEFALHLGIKQYDEKIADKVSKFDTSVETLEGEVKIFQNEVGAYFKLFVTSPHALDKATTLQNNVIVSLIHMLILQF
jgi:hypothetical protein